MPADRNPACRSLSLVQPAPELQFLAGTNLQSLHYWPTQQSGELAWISKLTALTCLSLGYITPRKAEDVHPLRDLSLLELKLDCCDGVPEALFVPGALTSLQDFHFLESVCHAPESDLVKSFILSHPSLRRLSGQACIFSDIAQSPSWRTGSCEPPFDYKLSKIV